MLDLATTVAPPSYQPLGHVRSLPAARPADLVAGARRALDHEPHMVRHYLELLAGLFAQEEQSAGESQIVIAVTPPTGGRSGPIKGGLASWQLRRVLQHIDDQLSDTIIVEDLAEVARLSSGHFCRAFKVTLGETPHAFLIRQRVRRAQLLMLETSDTLSQIAFACGLTDQAHLTRLFRRMIGETPLVWRRTWQPGR